MQKKTVHKIMFTILMIIIVVMCVIAVVIHPDNQDHNLSPNTIRLTHSVQAKNMANADKKCKIRKGIRLHYKKEKYGILIWNDHYQKDIKHQYVLVPSRTVNYMFERSKQK